MTQIHNSPPKGYGCGIGSRDYKRIAIGQAETIKNLEAQVKALKKKLELAVFDKEGWEGEYREEVARTADLERQLAEATQWRSPETAPRNTYFLALMYGNQPCVIARNAANTTWICLYSAITFEDDDGPHFTGWLPLPEPKKEGV